jgi:hypothetical protein
VTRNLQDPTSCRKQTSSSDRESLFKSGRNRKYDLADDFGWLSPISFEFLDSLPGADKSGFVCTPQLSQRRNHRLPVESVVLKVIIYQILDQDENLCEKVFHSRNFRKRLEESIRADAEDEQSNTTFRVASNDPQGDTLPAGRWCTLSWTASCSQIQKYGALFRV